MKQVLLSWCEWQFLSWPCLLLGRIMSGGTTSFCRHGLTISRHRHRATGWGENNCIKVPCSRKEPRISMEQTCGGRDCLWLPLITDFGKWVVLTKKMLEHNRVQPEVKGKTITVETTRHFNRQGVRVGHPSPQLNSCVGELKLHGSFLI